MSVIRFDSAEMLIAKKMLKFVVGGANQGDFERFLRYTKAWQEEAQWAKDDDRKTMSNVIDRLFWYVQVANRIAYALQYQEEPGLFDKDDIEESWSEMNSYRCSNAELRGALSHINYNLCTNDGRVFLPEEWADCWNRVQDFVTHLQADRADKQLDGPGQALWQIAERVGINAVHVQSKEA